MEKRKVILDCDPGHDDAFAIMLAAQHLDLLGVTTVGGNGFLENTTRNALQVLDVIGRSDVKVYPGHAGPSTKELVIADNVHGKSAMDGPQLPPPSKSAESKHGVDFIVDTVMSTDDVTLIATGPLTNIASALNKEPRIAQRAKGLYIMGGGAYCGNWTAAAEFNIYVDPEAAYKVFHSGMPIYMCGVNLTRQCPVLRENVEKMRALGNKAGKFAAELLDFFARGGDAHLHDPCAVAWIIDPSIVTSAYLHVDIELDGTLTRGMTVTDLRPLQGNRPEADIDLDTMKRWNDAPEGSPFRGLMPNTHVGLRLDSQYGLWRKTMDNNAVKDPEIVLSMENITKIYSNGFVANKDVNLQLRKGEIHGLVGENGAGKTTLMKVLFGHEQPEGGRILLNGEEVHIESPLHALDLGIGMVHQHFMLVNSLSVAENMVLGAEPKKRKLFYDKKEAIRMTEETAQKFNLPVDPNALIKDLTVGYKQRVEILKVLLRGVHILILDEPTAVLTPQETEELFEQLINLKNQGYTIVFISHKLQEVKQICDRITVLRLGQVTGSAEIKDVSIQDISRLMVGRDVMLDIEKDKAKPKKTVLKVRDLVHTNVFGVNAIDHISFDVRAGEILGVAGVEGNGQSELSETICGLMPLQHGTVEIDGKSIAHKSIHAIRAMGVGMVHEDRMIYGVSNPQPIEENLISDRYATEPYSKRGVMNYKYIREWSKERIKEFKVKCDGPEAPVKTLSGGNVQKVVAAREFSSDPKLLIASHPTRGIDVGATDLIRRKIVDLRDQKDTATLLFSADLNELINVSDSIIVLYEGKIVAYFEDLTGITPEALGEYMLGVKKQDDAVIGGVVHE